MDLFEHLQKIAYEFRGFLQTLHETCATKWLKIAP